MSNKIVPNIYRAVIDDVMTNIKGEFEEYGVPEDVLADLQAKWEQKVIQSHVAEFDNNHGAHAAHAAPPPPGPVPVQVQQHAYAPMHIMQPHPYGGGPHHIPYPPPHLQQPGQPNIKTEPVDARYILSAPPGQAPPMTYTLPPLPGPQIARAPPPPPQHQGLGGTTSVLSFAPPPATNGSNGQSANGNASGNNTNGSPMGRPYVPPTASSSQRIPQVDGPSSASSSSSPSPPAYAPRSSHPSLPVPTASTSANNNAALDSEAINSDLDDSSDTEGEDDVDDANGGALETDIVFCTYDKVARVKNKWKCVLKDGMVHVNGRDYLFQKCTGEFEW